MPRPGDRNADTDYTPPSRHTIRNCKHPMLIADVIGPGAVGGRRRCITCGRTILPAEPADQQIDLRVERS